METVQRDGSYVVEHIVSQPIIIENVMECVSIKQKHVMENAHQVVPSVEIVQDASHQMTDHSKNVMEYAFLF